MGEPAAEEGERKPFMEEEESGGLLFLDCVGFEAALAFCSLAWVLGLRLRDRARFSRLESEEGDSGSESSEMVVVDGRFLAADRVMGAK